MKSNELRLGNWIKYMNRYSIVSADTVKNLYDWEKKPATQRHDVIHNPIPITYEILVSIGFIDYAKNGMGCRIAVNSADELFFYTPDRSIRYQTIGSGFARELSHIKYLHDLQNLYYSLTGKELEVDL